jgi:thymidylate kinase
MIENYIAKNGAREAIRTEANSEKRLIVEIAGLPGAGKTTICKLVTLPHVSRGSVGLANFSAVFGSIPLLWCLFMLSLSIRPISWRRLLRAAKMTAFLRYYSRAGQGLVLLDQGLIQKLWSMLIGSAYYSPILLERLMTTLRPFAPDHVVWIKVSPPVAARRIAGRMHGNSRFDGLAFDEIVRQIEPHALLLQELVKKFSEKTNVKLWILDGEEPIECNAYKLSKLLRMQMLLDPEAREV